MRKKPSSFDRTPGRDKNFKKDSGKGARGGDDRPYKSSSDRKFDGPKRSFGKSDDNERPKRSFNKDDRGERSFDKPKRSFDRSEGDSERPKRSFNKDDRGGRSFDKPKRSFDRSEGDSERPKRNFNKDDRGGRSFDKPKRSFDRSEGDSDRPKRSFNKDDRGEKSFDKPKRSFDREDKSDKKEFGKKSFTIKKNDDFDKAYPLGSRKVSGPFRKKFQEEQAAKSDESVKPERKRRRRDEEEEVSVEKDMTLNKYVAHSGECSRREAAALVKQGKVKVNGELMLDPGYRVKDTDHVSIAGKKLKPRRDFVYILLNKPKDFITTTEDPEGRKTVMDLVDNAGIDRLYPVGRLDRNTTGLLLMTNDGDLAQKLSHPSYEIKKVYQATLDKPLTKAHFEQIVNGLTLEDGEVHVDALAYLDEKNELGLEIHNGRNRIVRRIFESLGYEVEKLDRVMYAGLTKKNLPRGKWRFLEDKEIIMLKHFKS